MVLFPWRTLTSAPRMLNVNANGTPTEENCSRWVEIWVLVSGWKQRGEPSSKEMCLLTFLKPSPIR